MDWSLVILFIKNDEVLLHEKYEFSRREGQYRSRNLWAVACLKGEKPLVDPSNERYGYRTGRYIGIYLANEKFHSLSGRRRPQAATRIGSVS